MVELQDIPFCLDGGQLMRQLRIQPETDYATAFTTLLDTVIAVARPKAVYDMCYVEEKADDSVVLNDVRLTSRALRRNLDQAERVFPYVATCGTEADAVTAPNDDVLQALWLWTIKEALVHTASAHLHEHLAGRYRMTRWATMHPGSGDSDVWPIEQQKELFRVLGNVETVIGVRLMDSMLMVPSMSVSGIVFPTETEFDSCQVCHREDCPRRIAPFNEDVWRAMCGD